jgi:signal transduction histidine kinase
MNIYQRKQQWKIVLFATAVVIVIASLWYTNRLVRKIADEEREKVKLWAKSVQKKAKLVKFTNDLFTEMKAEERKKAELYASATQRLATADVNDLTFILNVIQSNTTVPVILVNNQDQITGHRNLDSISERDTALVKERLFRLKAKNIPQKSLDEIKKKLEDSLAATFRSRDSIYVSRQLSEMKLKNPPIAIEYFQGKRNYLYYNDSKVFADIKLVFDSLIKSFIAEVAVNTASVPVIYTDSTGQNVLAVGNVDSAIIAKPDKLKARIQSMSEQNTPIEIDLGEGGKNYIYYEQSTLLTQLKYYPFVQFGVIGVFLIIAYSLFSTARKSEQNQVWVGMSKETAHQLGTPLSSLMAWVELLKAQGVEDSIIHELNRDVDRLNTITERFSKIGSVPNMQSEDIRQVLEHAVDYIKLRTSRNVSFSINCSEKHPIYAKISIPLFEWVVENLCKNSVDAMDGKGSITIDITDATQFVYIDFTDTGKGIPKGKIKTVFEPGFTTKQRGWGLGLSLCKRIIENYHNGKIFVKRSEPNTGTTFRIVLNK